MVQIQEQQPQDDNNNHHQQNNQRRPYSHPQSQSQQQQASSSSSSSNNNKQIPTSPLSPVLSPLPRLTAPPPPQQQAPPPQNDNSAASSPSSISTDHTFHGYSSPTKSPHIPSPSPSPPHSIVPSPLPPPIVSTSRLVRDLPPDSVTKAEPDAETGFASHGPDDNRRRGSGGAEGGDTEKKPRRRPMVRGPRSDKLVKRTGLVLRFCELVVCLVSFSVMAADKNRGWALDSFDRYIEFRYSMSVNAIGFAYSGLQGLNLLLQLTTGKDLVRSQLRYCFDFALDQILAYLLLSSSSSAYTRVDDWISNWGTDKFPAMASASVGVSFLAFIAFALSSLISGYVLCTNRVT